MNIIITTHQHTKLSKELEQKVREVVKAVFMFKPVSLVEISFAELPTHNNTFAMCHVSISFTWKRARVRKFAKGVTCEVALRVALKEVSALLRE